MQPLIRRHLVELSFFLQLLNLLDVDRVGSQPPRDGAQVTRKHTSAAQSDLNRSMITERNAFRGSGSPNRACNGTKLQERPRGHTDVNSINSRQRRRGCPAKTREVRLCQFCETDKVGPPGQCLTLSMSNAVAPLTKPAFHSMCALLSPIAGKLKSPAKKRITFKGFCSAKCLMSLEVLNNFCFCNFAKPKKCTFAT
jgi:hypothetical protein